MRSVLQMGLNRFGRAGLVGLCVWLAGCQSPAPEAAPYSDSDAEASAALPDERAPDSARFSGVRAWSHLAVLEKIGPRVSGRKGAKRTRAYLREELEALGMEVRERRVEVMPAGSAEALELVHLVAVLPGDSPDVFLLAAHYDTQQFDSFRYVGTNESGSGPALLLELARVMSLAPRPYTLWFTFIDGDALHGREGGEEGGEPLPPVGQGKDGDNLGVSSEGQLEGPGGTAAPGLLGSRSFVRAMATNGELAGVRLAVVFDAVADSDLHVARDLNSNRVYRETFWEAAHDLDHGRAFPADRMLESPRAAHRAFQDRGVRGIVAIVDNRYGGDSVPGAYWHTEYDTRSQCSPQSLQTVGEVSIEALSRIAERLSKIDRFAAHPLDGAGGARAQDLP